MKLSVVATLYRSEPFIGEFLTRMGAAAGKIAGDDYEIILVNDGSPDDSLAVALTKANTDPHLVVVDLSRNFGHHKAMMTGLAHADGDLVFLIDSDLEEEPEWLEDFHGQLAERGCDVVYGVQKARKGGLFERWSGSLFYGLLRTLTALDLPKNVVTARLMTRRYVEALLRHEEREVFLAGLWQITGFEQRPMMVIKKSSSASTYTFLKKLDILVNSITSFSSAPLVGIFYMGIAIMVIMLIYTSYLVINWTFFANPPSGWTSVIVSVWLLGGMMISFIGVIGIYLSKIFSETKRRPYTIVRQVNGKRK